MLTICSHKECVTQLKLMQHGDKLKLKLMHEQGEDDGEYNEGDDTAVICITNKDNPVPEEIQQFASKLLHLEFDDVEFAQEEYVLCEKSHIERAIKFAKRHENVIVCCHAGVSRSAALAFVIECTRVAHPRLAMGLWNKKRHHPNRMIVRLGGEILNNPELERCHTLWMNNP